ncbi:hypothetical protein IQ255_09955 [Pleurocapsales cyanobacterium LEGE 10410]|nr:hypothetical protein [Pleurocapsales cyanobacterium LEGE 10410]
MVIDNISNTQNFNSGREFEEDLLPEYNFDYSKPHSNRFATSNDKNITVKLEPDVAKVFQTSDEVNKALRAIISVIPEKK